MNGSKRRRSRFDAAGHASWEIRVPLGGRDPVTGRPRYATRTFRGSEAAADTARAELVAEVMAGRRQRGKAVSTSGTFGWLLDQWVEAKAAVRKPTTVAGYREKVDSYVRDFVPPGETKSLGETRLNDLTVGHFDALYGSMRKRGLAPATIDRTHAACRGSINFAIRRGWYTRLNPTLPSERPALKRRRKLRIPKPELVTAMLTDYAIDDPDMAAAFLVTASVGSRRSMGLGLRWRDVDFAAMTVDLIGSVTSVRGQIYEDEHSSKEDEDNTVSLDPWTMEILRRHRARCEERARLAGVSLRPSSYVFSPDPDGTAPWHPDTLTKTWRRIADDAGLDGVRLHDLRHMVATSLLRAGVPVEVVSKRLGHARTSITLDMYGHVLDEVGARDAANIMGDLMHGADPDKLRKKAHKKQAKRSRKAAAIPAVPGVLAIVGT
jgi:integrase